MPKTAKEPNKAKKFNLCKNYEKNQFLEPNLSVHFIEKISFFLKEVNQKEKE